jgi:hypothetical protein
MPIDLAPVYRRRAPSFSAILRKWVGSMPLFMGRNNKVETLHA